MREETRNTVTKVCVGVFALLTISAFLAWINNIFIAGRYLNNLFQNQTTGEWTSDKKETFQGPITYLDWSAVDYSTISTLIPFIGFLLITIGFVRIYNREERVSEYFPFFRNHNPIVIALGLIGTVWGLIMMGYYPEQKLNVSELVLCMHTALYSTFVALIWAYILVPAIRYSMQWWGDLRPDGVDLISSFKDLDQVIFGAAKSLNNVNAEVDKLEEGIANTSLEFKSATAILKEFKERTGVDAYEAVQKACISLSGVCSNISSILERLNAESQDRQKIAEEQLKTAREQQRFLEELRAELEKLKEERQGMKEELDDAERGRAEAEEKISKSEAQLQKVLQKVTEAIQV